MKHIAISALCVLAVLFVLPGWFPFLHQHAFSLGQLDIKWEHCLALGVVVLVLRGGK